MGPSVPDPEVGGPWPSVPRDPFLTGERGLVFKWGLGLWVCLTGSEGGMTGEVIGIGIDRDGREGGMEMGFGVVELVGMFGVTVLDITFEFSLLITGLGVGLIGLEMTIGVGITVLVLGLIVRLGVETGTTVSSSSMIEYTGFSDGGSHSSLLESQTSITGSSHGRHDFAVHRAL